MAGRRVTSNPKPCLHCGEMFGEKPGYGPKIFGRQKFCSKSCSARHGGKLAKRKAGSQSDRFWQHVRERDFSVCWEWQGNVDGAGYGLSNWAGKIVRAHRLSLQLSGRPVLKGMHACHTCNNKTCVNPCHLYVGTPAQNSRDAANAGAHQKKLNVAKVRDIRSSDMPVAHLAARFGVSETAIRKVINRKSWAHV